MRDYRLDRLRSERERGDRTLDQEKDRKADARLKAPLASARDHDRDDRVEDREYVGNLSEVVVLAGEPGRASWVHAVEETVDDKEDRRQQHQEDDRTERPCHPRPPSFPRNVIPRRRLYAIRDARSSPAGRIRRRGPYRDRRARGSRCLRLG